MKLHRLEYEDKRLGWKLEPVDFANLTLLVGVSGVGKTRILRSILALKSVAEGKSLRGIRWSVEFSATNGALYKWTGEFENTAGSALPDFIEDLKDELESGDDARSKPKILFEQLTENGVSIVERDAEGIRLHGQSTPKLSSFESVLNTLREEDSISSAHKSFSRIVYSDQSASVSNMNALPWFDFSKLSKRYTTLEAIRESTVPTFAKVALCHTYVPEVFAQIKARFIGVFPHVTDVKMEPLKEEGVPVFFNEVPFLQIKEAGIGQWITQQNISSGMFRTFMHLSELFLSPEGTVILIDEFENSLGVNCIDVVTQDLLNESRKIQFIVTSHHPYVINNVGVEHWKIVSRHGAKVITHDARALAIGKSRHDAFMQLLNAEEYKDGIEVVA